MGEIIRVYTKGENMNLLCKLGFHKYEGTYIEGIDDRKYKPHFYNIPESGVLAGWKRCSRCDEFYEKTYWGDTEKIRVLLEGRKHDKT